MIFTGGQTTELRTTSQVLNQQNCIALPSSQPTELHTTFQGINQQSCTPRSRRSTNRTAQHVPDWQIWVVYSFEVAIIEEAWSWTTVGSIFLRMSCAFHLKDNLCRFQRSTHTVAASYFWIFRPNQIISISFKWQFIKRVLKHTGCCNEPEMYFICLNIERKLDEHISVVMELSYFPEPHVILAWNYIFTSVTLLLFTPS